MLIVAFLFAVSINFDKIAMLNSDPFFGMALTVLAIGVAFVLMSAYSRYTGRNRSLNQSAHDPGHTRPVVTSLPGRHFARTFAFLSACLLPLRLRQ